MIYFSTPMSETNRARKINHICFLSQTARKILLSLKKPRLNAAFADFYTNRAHAPRTSADICRSLFIFVDSGIHIATGEHYPDKIFSGFSHNPIFTRK